MAEPATPEETQAGASNGGTPPSSDYLGRIREGGDFAAEELRKYQSRADQTEARYNQLLERLGGEEGELYKWLGTNGVTAAQLASATKNYIALRQHPATQRYVEALESTGELPQNAPNNPSYDDDEEEYLTREEKHIRALEEKIQRLEAGMGGLTASTGERSLQEHLSRFRREWHLSDEELSKVSARMLTNVAEWKKTPQGQQLLRDLGDPTKYDSVIEPIALKHMKDVAPQVFRELPERERLRQRQQVAQFATDGPKHRATTGHEAPADMHKWPAEKVLQHIREHPELLPPE